MRIADLPARVGRAAVEGSMRSKEAAKLIRQQDEKKSAWVQAVMGSADPWDPDHYDLLIPTDKTELHTAVDLVVQNLSKDVIQPTPSSNQAVKDFLIAARTERTLAEQGHSVGVECTEGAVTLTINKNVLMLGRLEDELKAIAEPVEGVDDGVGALRVRGEVVSVEPVDLMLVGDDDLGPGLGLGPPGFAASSAAAAAGRAPFRHRQSYR